MHKLLFRQIFWLLTIMALSACGSNDDPIIQPDLPSAEEQAICFSSSYEEGEELVTRAPEASSCTRASINAPATRATTPLNQNFIVYGYKTLSGSDSPNVFPGYNVTYTASSAGSSEDNTHNYSYVDPSKDQFIKYWDYSAIEYRYWGYVPHPDNKITTSTDGKELTISGLSVSITEPANYLVSTLKTVTKDDYNKVVQLRFVHPYAKVRVMVYSGEKLEPAHDGKEGDAIELSQISFGPNDATKKILKTATVKVSYLLSGTDPEAYSIESLSYLDNNKFEYKGFDTSSSSSEKVLKLTSANCASNSAAIAYPNEAAAASVENSFYFVLPTGTGITAPDYKFSVSVDGDDELKTAIVPSVYMHWKPNYQYTYIFKILEGGLIFVDAKVEDGWKFGGSGADKWTNW